MTKAARDFNDKYNLNVTQAGFLPTNAEDKVNDLIGKPQKNWLQIVKRFFKNPIAVLALVVFLGIIVASIVIPVLSDYSATKTINTVDGEVPDIRSLPPSGQWLTRYNISRTIIQEYKSRGLVENVDFRILTSNPGINEYTVSVNIWKLAEIRNPGLPTSSVLGTTSEGFDSWTRTWYGTWESMKLALLVTVSATIVGTLLGSWIGMYFGSFFEIILMRVLEAYESIPNIFWLFFVLSLLPRNFWGLFIYSSLSGWMYSFYVARRYMIRHANSETMTVAKTLGVSRLGLIFKHALPTYIGYIFNSFILVIDIVIIDQAYISLFGFDFDPNAVSIGKTLEEARKSISSVDSATMQLLVPSLIILVINLSGRFIQMGVNDAFNPKYARK